MNVDDDVIARRHEVDPSCLGNSPNQPQVFDTCRSSMLLGTESEKVQYLRLP